jgi:2'-5' RNA ligase
MEETLERYRLFVAIEAPEYVKDQIARTQAHLQTIVRNASVSWARREQFHLTLKFLGNVEVSRMQALHLTLSSLCKGFGPLALKATGVNCFPNWNKPRVLWVGVNDAAGRLEALQKTLEDAMAEFTFEKPEKKYVGHITFGRVKSIGKQDSRTLREAATVLAGRAFGDWTVDMLHLVRSQLSSGGSSHSTLFKINLS